jgi:hypothetical protein
MRVTIPVAVRLCGQPSLTLTISPTFIDYLQITREIGDDWMIAGARDAHINERERDWAGPRKRRGRLHILHDADHTAPENLGLIVAIASKFNEVTDVH